MAASNDDAHRATTRQRVLAVIALVAAGLLAVLLVVFLASNLLWLLIGIAGLALVGGGGWWLITEQMPRRAMGIVGLVAGVALVVVALLKAVSESESPLLRIEVVLLLMLITVGTARGALVRDLHASDLLSAAKQFTPRQPVLICNPWSGGGKVAKFDLAAKASALGVEVIMLDKGLDLEELARDAVARGADCLGMAGGDGSQALVASIAIEHDLPFVLISAGTRNHFAQDLGYDKEDPAAGLIAFTEGVERRIDYATVGDRLFVNNVSLGVYATIVQQDEYRDAKVETSKQLLPEMLGRTAEPFDLQFTTDDGTQVDGAFLILVSNNPYVLKPALDASTRRVLDSGQLGVFAINTATGAEAAALLARTTFGLGRNDPHAIEFITPTFEVHSRSGSAFAGVDGEALELPTPLVFRSHPRGLRLLVPPGNLEVAEKRRARGFNPSDLWAVARGKLPHRLRPDGAQRAEQAM